MLRRNLRPASLMVWLFLVAAMPGFAQQVTGTISGRVTDSSGAVIPGTTVQVQNVETGLARSVQTDAGGRYEARNLPVGSYTITVQQAGFRTEVRSGVTLTVASEVVVNFALSVGEVQERVEVTAEAPAIETTTVTLSGLISQQQIRDLPLNGRSFDDLALLTPGVVNQTNADGGISGHGQRIEATLYLLDGTTTNDARQQGNTGTVVGTKLGVEAIREFRVMTHSFSAEYGGRAGAVVSAITQSGTNAFHGSVYEFFRNNELDARDFFNVANAPDPSPLPAFRQNQFGASVGGPVRRDRIFFFGNYEGLRRRRGETNIAIIPDLNTRRGVIPGQPAPLPVNPAIAPYLDLYPVPNGNNFGDGLAEYVSDVSTAANEDYYMGRGDFQVSNNDSFYLRYVHNPSRIDDPGPVPPFGGEQEGSTHLAVLSETHILSPTMLNEFRFAYNRTAPRIGVKALDFKDGAMDFVPGQGFGTIGFSFTAGTRTINTLGTSAAMPQFFPQNLFQATDTFNYSKGPHSLKFGFSVERMQFGQYALSRRRGEYTFSSSLSRLVAGQATRARWATIGGTSSDVRGWRQSLVGWFVQNDYRVRPNLTLNLGFRHEFVTSPYEVNGKSATHLNITDLESTVGNAFESSKLNVSPRVGLAWDPTGSGKTSVRLGGGVFHNQLLGRDWYLFSQFDHRFINTRDVRNPNPSIFPRITESGAAAGAKSTKIVTPHPDTPTVIHYNLDIQRQLTPTITVSAGYVGSYGYNLTVEAEQNIRIAELRDGSTFFSPTAPFVNPNFTSMLQLLTNTISNHNALQLTLKRSFAGGFLLQSHYTWSKTMGNGDSTSPSTLNNTSATLMDVTDPERDYSLSAYDQRHVFVLNGRYELPFGNLLPSRLARAVIGGWEVNGIFKTSSGFPVNIVTGFNNSNNGDATEPDRPNLNPGFSNSPTEGTTAGCGDGIIKAGEKLGTANRWYDPCAYGLPPAGTFGNLGRNVVAGPGHFTVDFTLAKKFPVKEGMDVEFRAEAFNILNRANFDLPNNLAFSADRTRNGAAGRIIATQAKNREIQLGLKLIF